MLTLSRALECLVMMLFSDFIVNFQFYHMKRAEFISGRQVKVLDIDSFLCGKITNKSY